MGSLLREVLKSICVENGWVYAVLWKPNCRDPMILMWEDGYYEGGVAVENSFSAFGSHPLVSREGEILRKQAKYGHAKFCSNDQLDIFVANMKDQIHVVGRGIIGRVAVMGTHRWIFQETYMNECFDCTSAVYGTVYQNSADWYCQFSAGIQTVAVVSVSPYGVLQCGSLHRVTETLSRVDHLKSKFTQLEANIFQVKEGPLPSVCEIPSQHPFGHPSCLLSAGLQTHKVNLNLSGGIYGDTSMISSVPNSSIPATEAHVDSFIPTSLLSSNLNMACSTQTETVLVGRNAGDFSISSMLLNQYPSQRSDPLHNTSHVPNIGTKIDQKIDSLVPLNYTSGLVIASEVSSHLYSRCDVVDPTNSLSEAAYSDASVAWNSTHSKSSHLAYSDGYQYPSDSLSLTSAFNDSKLSQLHTNASRLRFAKPSNKSVIDAHTICATSALLGNDLFQAIGSSSFSASSLDKCDSFQRELSEIMPEFMKDTLANDIQHTPKGNLHAIKVEPKPSSSLIVTSGGEISETYKPLNSSFDGLPLDIQTSGPQSRGLSIVFQLKNVDDSGTESAFSSLISDSNAASMSNMPKDIQIDNSYFSESRSDNLLDAIVSSFQSYTDQSPNGCTYSKTMLRGSDSSNSSDGKQNVVADMSQYFMKSTMVISNLHSVSEGSGSKNVLGSQIDDPSKSQTSFRMDDGPNVQHDNPRMTHTGTSEESSKGKQKNPKPGESTRPRPKDRQLIQDRVKELREIVPNGAKCSIDALLERTIKHMLFLQSVTKYADTLKHAEKSKLISKDGTLLLKDSFEGRATWAFEVGSKSMVCPIIVEEMNLPHQMLVEMLCEERGFFLEIAELIREMGLTILKGVMEMRDDKIWAHFSVEATRDISRMEVFMSLVHLLEQISNSTIPNSMSIGSKIPVFDSNGQTSIPSPGFMERLL